MRRFLLVALVLVPIIGCNRATEEAMAQREEQEEVAQSRPAAQFKEKYFPPGDGGELLNILTERLAELRAKGDPAQVGFDLEKMGWCDRWERFEASGESSFKEFYWDEYQDRWPAKTRERFEEEESFAETYSEYKRETDRSWDPESTAYLCPMT